MRRAMKTTARLRLWYWWLSWRLRGRWQARQRRQFRRQTDIIRRQCDAALRQCEANRIALEATQERLRVILERPTNGPV